MDQRFPTAPDWYRTVLTVEDAVLRRLRHRLPTQAHLHGDDADTAGYILNERLGILAAERIVPGGNASPYMVQHVARYLWAMDAARGRTAVDLGSGDGYGSYLLSWTAKSVIGLDLSDLAVSAATETYDGPEYRQGDLTIAENIPEADLGVCFEVLEHIEAAEDVLRAASQRVPRLLLSVPNPLVGGSHINPHHVNDWPLSKLRSVLRTLGAKRVTMHHQGVRSYAVRRTALPIHGTWLADVRF